MAKKQEKKNHEKGGLFIPGGLFLGMGFGFLYGQLIPGIFIGLGAGFVLFGITQLISKNEK